MNKLQNYKFTYNGTASFTLPEGMRLDRENRTAYEDRFQLVSPDGTLRLCIEFFNSTKSARELIEELNDREHEVICPARAITAPTGIEGYTITYSEGEDRYEECTLDLGEDVRVNFWLLQKRDTPCDQSLYEQVKKEVLENIQKV